MPGSIRCEIIHACETFSGVENMAIDEVLLERAIDDNIGHFRLYQWSAPTITLGYFQDYSPAAIPAEMSSLDVVRRLTGGGAILHHHELTYSCSLPSGHAWSDNPSALYSEIHQVLQQSLLRQGFSCELRGAGKTFPEGEPFLCYARGDERDLVAGHDKVVGSAQRRRKGAILQHGSILMGRSEYAPQFSGIDQLLPDEGEIKVSTLCEDILDGVLRLFENCFKSERISANLRPRIEELVRAKYAYPGRRFEQSKEPRSSL